MARRVSRAIKTLDRLGLAPDGLADAAGQVEAAQARQVEPGDALDEAALMAMADITGADVERALADWDRWARQNAPSLVGLLRAK